MKLNEAASLLGWSRNRVRVAIEEGIETPSARTRVRLQAVSLPHGYDIAQDDLDEFLAIFERDEPGRHPPTAVRRLLLIEAGYKCAVCRDNAPLEFHHVLEWAALKHHDPAHMLAVCANCHGKITRYGEPDLVAQKEIKKQLKERREGHAVSALSSAQGFAPEHALSIDLHKTFGADGTEAVQTQLEALQTTTARRAWAQLAAMRGTFAKTAVHAVLSTAAHHRAIADTGVLVLLKSRAHRARFKIDRSAVVLQVETLDQETIATVMWEHDDAAATLLSKLVVELNQVGSFNAASSIDASLLSRVVDTVTVGYQARFGDIPEDFPPTTQRRERFGPNEISPIIELVNDQWVVTTRGLESLEDDYWMFEHALREPDLLWHMSLKNWVNKAFMSQALDEARSIHKINVDREGY